MNWQKLCFWRKPTPSISEPLDRTHADLLVIQRLESAGADLSQKREVLHYLYLPSLQAAGEVARELRAEGYEVEQRPAADAGNSPPNPWLVLAKMEDIVDGPHVEQATARMSSLAARYAGEYDGWEAAAEP
jgi:hypothetical protein